MDNGDDREWDNELFRNILLVALAVGMYFITTELLPEPDLTPPSPHPGAKVNMTSKPSRERVIVIYEDFLPSEGLHPSTIEDNLAFYHHAQPCQGITSQAKYLVVFIADEAWRKGIDAAVKSLSENFDILLLHHQYVPGYWEGFEWINQVQRVIITEKRNWLMMKCALHPESLPPYEYVVIWHKDLEGEDFDAEEYIKLMKKHHIEISHPCLELNKMQTPMKSKKEFNCESSISTMSTAFSRDAWLCFWDMVLTDKIPRPDYEEPAQGIMPDADVIHQSDTSLNNKEWCSKEWKRFCERLAELEASYSDKSDSPGQHSDEL